MSSEEVKYRERLADLRSNQNRFVRLSGPELDKLGNWLGHYISLGYVQEEADVLVLRKVRERPDVANDFRLQLQRFLNVQAAAGLYSVPLPPDCSEVPWMLALVYAYEPGMYVEAARFLWEKS